MLGSLDVTRIVTQARQNKRQSPQYLSTMAQKAADRRPALQRRLLKKAADSAPHDVQVLTQYGAALSKSGDHDAARDVLRDALSQHPNNPIALYHYAEHLERAGNAAEAINVFGRLNREFSPVTYGARFGAAYDAAFARASADLPARGATLAALRSRQAPNGAILQRLRDLARHFKRPVTFDDIETRNACTPAPPHNAVALRRHVMLIASLATQKEAADIVTIGDSHAEFWPGELWGDRIVVNLGVAGDHVQTTLWRLAHIKSSLKPPVAFIVVAGTNNLAMGDAPSGICAGLAALDAALARAFPTSRRLILTLPPAGPAGNFQATSRLATNTRLAASDRLRVVDVDRVLIADGKAERSCYWDDEIHLSFAGYHRLQDLVDAALAGAHDPARP